MAIERKTTIESIDLTDREVMTVNLSLFLMEGAEVLLHSRKTVTVDKDGDIDAQVAAINLEIAPFVVADDSHLRRMMNALKT